jgi:phenylacetate-CoA ligase
VLNAFGYHLSPAGAMFESACLELGARVVPAGVGNLDLQVQACVDLGVTAFVGLPSYLKALLERAEAAGEDPRAWPLARAFVSAEPLPPSLRAWLAERVPVVRQGYGTAETGNLGFESSAADGLHVPDDALVQVCDLSTGAARYDGGEGQVVVTILDARGPVVRFGTGDLSAWATDEAGDASIGTPRIRGWLGRVGDAVKVRGMFLHPRQVEQVMAEVPEVEGWRFVVDRVDHRDVLRCELVPAGAADVGALRSAVRERVRSGLRFDVEVTAVGALAGDGPIADVRVWD